MPINFIFPINFSKDTTKNNQEYRKKKKKRHLVNINLKLTRQIINIISIPYTPIIPKFRQGFFNTIYTIFKEFLIKI